MYQKVTSEKSDFLFFDRQSVCSGRPFSSCSDYTLIVPEINACELITRTTEKTLSPRQLALISPFFPYRLEFEHSTAKCNVLHFRPRFLGQTFIDSIQFRKIKSMLEKIKGATLMDASTNHDVISQLLTLKNSYDLSELIRLLSILEQLTRLPTISELNKATFVLIRARKNEHRMKMIFKFVSDHLGEKLTVLRVATHCCMAKSTFSRFFHANAGCSFHQYIIEQRVRQASRLLLSTNWSIARICHEAGFSSLSSFNAKFKTITNKTPSTYRSSQINTCSSLYKVSTLDIPTLARP